MSNPITLEQLSSIVTGLKKYIDEHDPSIAEVTHDTVFTTVSNYPYSDLIVSDSTMIISATTTGTFNIRLREKPLSNQTVELISNNSILTLLPTTLTFTPDNYNIAQTVTIALTGLTADNDGDEFIVSVSSEHYYKDITVEYKAEALGTTTINYDLSNQVTDNILVNKGSGGDKYNANMISNGGTFAFTENGLQINNQAYIKIPWTADSNINSWTMEMVVSEIVYNNTSYGRVFRSDTDTPSLYFGKSLGWRTKIGATKALTTDTDSVNDPQYIIGKLITLKYDSVKGICYLQVGENTTTLSANMSVTNTEFYIGNNDSTKNYYFDTMTISEFRVYNYLK